MWKRCCGDRGRQKKDTGKQPGTGSPDQRAGGLLRQHIEGTGADRRKEALSCILSTRSKLQRELHDIDRSIRCKMYDQNSISHAFDLDRCAESIIKGITNNAHHFGLSNPERLAERKEALLKEIYSDHQKAIQGYNALLEEVGQIIQNRLQALGYKEPEAPAQPRGGQPDAPQRASTINYGTGGVTITREIVGGNSNVNIRVGEGVTIQRDPGSTYSGNDGVHIHLSNDAGPSNRNEQDSNPQDRNKQHFGDGIQFDTNDSFKNVASFGHLNTFQDGTHFSEVASFKAQCTFGADCHFKKVTHFGAQCIFGANCHFENVTHVGIQCVFGDGARFIGNRPLFGPGCVFEGRIFLHDQEVTREELMSSAGTGGYGSNVRDSQQSGAESAGRVIINPAEPVARGNDLVILGNVGGDISTIFRGGHSDGQ